MGPSVCPLKAIIGQVVGSLHGVYLFKGPFQRREVRVEDGQLLPQVVAVFYILGSNPQPSVPKASLLTTTIGLHQQEKLPMQVSPCFRMLDFYIGAIELSHIITIGTHYVPDIGR